MKVQIDIPRDIEEYFEYIPENALSSVLVGMLRESLTHRLMYQSPKQGSNDLVDEIVNRLRGTLVMSTSQPVVSNHTTETSMVHEEDKSQEIESVETPEDSQEIDYTIDLDSDEDLDDDLMSLLK